jgi:hypothetical protein
MRHAGLVRKNRQYNTAAMTIAPAHSASIAIHPDVANPALPVMFTAGGFNRFGQLSILAKPLSRQAQEMPGISGSFSPFL